MSTRLSSLILATFALGKPLLTCRPGPHAPTCSLGHRAVLKLGCPCPPRTWQCCPLQRPSQHRECMLCHVVGHWILLPWWDSQEIFFALTDELIIQNVHNKFNMGISSQPVQSAKDSWVVSLCLCSPGVVLNALLSLNQNRGLWLTFCCHERGPDTISSGLQT